MEKEIEDQETVMDVESSSNTLMIAIQQFCQHLQFYAPPVLQPEPHPAEPIPDAMPVPIPDQMPLHSNRLL
jgi:hypothetical protein